MSFRVSGIATDLFEHLRHGGADAHGQKPLVRLAEGGANPCRHCLGLIANGEPKLVLAHRPFAGEAQPYAETGPIFLHQAACTHYDSDALPPWFALLNPAAIRGYDNADWILYETGQIVPGAELAATCESILEDPRVAYIHIRSKYGCFQCRVDRN